MTKLLMSAMLVAGLLAVAGCGQQVAQTVPPSNKEEDDTLHDEWWCKEHGVREADCSMCSAKVAKAYQNKGDWCKDHNRAKSQCFICDPSLQVKFAAEYRAKFDKEPPEPTDNMPEKKK